MIPCCLSRIQDERNQKIAEVSREPGINRSTRHRLNNETATRVELDMVELLCRYLKIEVGSCLSWRTLAQQSKHAEGKPPLKSEVFICY
ncbi:helix-turn-helix domain-containing protein [Oceanisphaera sp. KMM 10153]|uniref:helix-turn-helix domain-containing protein n=1 Tax=Oceanisphaera submarina TaxID=3390193 RepID=UPI0039768B7B